MHDFGNINLVGYIGVVKPRSFSLPKYATTKQRSFLIESGVGTLPDAGTRRVIKGRWLSDDAPDTISTYDFEYVLDKEGKKVDRLPEPVDDTMPVKLAGEEPQAKVRRKRG
jgi:hypothetical protein